MWGGLTPERAQMKLLLKKGLHNNSTPERFNLSSDSEIEIEEMMPIKFLRIDNMVAHGPHFNVTIW